MNGNEHVAKRGRILLFTAVSDASGGTRLELRAVGRVKGAVYTLEPFCGGLLAGVNARLQLFQWVPRLDSNALGSSGASHKATRGFDGDLRMLATQHGFITVLSTWTDGDRVFSARPEPVFSLDLPISVGLVNLTHSVNPLSDKHSARNTGCGCQRQPRKADFSTSMLAGQR